MSMTADAPTLIQPTRSLPPSLPPRSIQVAEYATPGGQRATDTTPDYLMPPLLDEPRWYKNTWLAVAFALMALFGAVVFGYWAAGDNGVDQNAYLVGGRLLAEHGSMRYTLPNPYAFTGGMMVRATPPTVPDLKPGSNGKPVPDAVTYNPNSIYYPKYPFGLPLLYASFFWAFKVAAVVLKLFKVSVHIKQAAYWAFIVSPASAVIGVAGMYYLARLVSGSFAAALAAILLGTSQLMLMLADNPNSHSSCMAFIVWGMYFCVRWMQTSSYWRGVLGGLLVGYAATIRYNEILLFVPMCVVVLSRLPWNQWKSYVAVSLAASAAGAFELIYLNLANHHAYRFGLAPRWADSDIHTAIIASVMLLGFSIGMLVVCILNMKWPDYRMYLRALVPGIAWAVPVASLLLINRFTMGSSTGYDSTHESEFGIAFKWSFFFRNWEKAIRIFYDMGLFFVVPFAVAGIFMLFRKSWRLGLLLVTWVVPGVMLYMAYYWSPDFADAYARFFLTYLPALLVGTAVCFHDGILAGRKQLNTFDSPATKVAAFALLIWMVPGLIICTAHYLCRGHVSLVMQYSWIYVPGAIALIAVGYHEVPRMFGSRRENGNIALTLAAGMVVAVAAAISSFRTMHGLRDGSQANKIPLNDFRDRLSLAQTGQILLDKIPEHSVVFAEDVGGIQTPANYIQFLGDWQMYSTDAFSTEASRRGIGGGGNRNRRNGNGGGGPGGGGRNFGGPGGGPGGGGPGGGGPGGGGPGGPGGANATNSDTDPVATPVQPEQQEYHANLYKNMASHPDRLYALQADVVNKAFKENRKVFVAIAKDHTEEARNFSWNQSVDPLIAFKKNLLSAGTYKFKVISRWQDIALPEEKEEDTSLTDNSPMGGGRGGGMNVGRMFMGNDRLMDWQLIEITPWDVRSDKK